MALLVHGYSQTLMKFFHNFFLKLSVEQFVLHFSVFTLIAATDTLCSGSHVSNTLEGSVNIVINLE